MQRIKPYCLKILCHGIWLCCVLGHGGALAYDVRVAGPAPEAIQNRSVSVSDDGHIVVFGQGSIQIWDPTAQQWIQDSNEQHYADRVRHSATITHDGRVMFIGGVAVGNARDQLKTALSTTVVWSAHDRTWGSGHDLVTPRLAHTAVVLPNNDVLVLGGSAGVQRGQLVTPLLASVERLSSQGAVLRAPMSTARVLHTANVLRNGAVMVVGGTANDGKPLATVEIYDPEYDTWHSGPPLKIARTGHTTTVLADGSVLVVGGMDATGHAVAEVERWRTQQDHWDTVATLAEPRLQHQATLLNNGDVLISGGLRAFASRADTSVLSLELWQTASQQLSFAGELPQDFGSQYAQRVIDNTVLLFGSTAAGPVVLAWLPRALQNLSVPASVKGTLTRLADGRFLLAGGEQYGQASAAAYIYDARSERWTATHAMHWRRVGHRAVLLKDGRVLVLGGQISGADAAGRTGQGASFPAEIWDPKTQRWALFNTLQYANGSDEEPAVLADGRIMLSAIDNENIASHTVLVFRIWNPKDDTLTEHVQVPRTRAGGKALFFADGHLLYLGGIDQIQVRPDPRCTGELDPFGAGKFLASTTDPCVITQESSREGKRVDWWDPVAKTWQELRPAELSLNGMETYPLQDGGVLAWQRPKTNAVSRTRDATDLTRFLYLWQPHIGWRSLPVPAGLADASSVTPTVLEDGEVVLRMGSAQTWLWNEVEKQWHDIAHDALWDEDYGVFTADGKLLAFRTRAADKSAAMEVVWLNREAARWEPITPGYMNHDQPTIITLPQGQVMIAGGGLAMTQIWQSQHDSWRLSGYTPKPLRVAQGLLLQDGRVMLVGVPANDSTVLDCALWEPMQEQWSACGQWPLADAYRGQVILRYLDAQQVLLAYGQQAMLWNAEGRWVRTELRLPAFTTLPAVSVTGKTYTEALASVWNPVQKHWEDATDVLLLQRLNLQGVRTAGGNVLVTTQGRLLQWDTQARTLQLLELTPPPYLAGEFSALTALSPNCVLAWPTVTATRLPQWSSVALANLQQKQWTLYSAAWLPAQLNAALFTSNQGLIAGQYPVMTGATAAVERFSADCTHFKVLNTALYLPNGVITQPEPPAVKTTADKQLASQPTRDWKTAWLVTWQAHFTHVRQQLMGKLVAGVLMLLALLYFFMQRWGEYYSKSEHDITAYEKDWAILCVAAMVAVVVLGIPMVWLQISVGAVAALLAALVAYRLWSNVHSARARIIYAVPLLITNVFATLVLGTYFVDQLFDKVVALMRLA